MVYVLVLFSKSQASLYKVLCFGNYSPTIKVGAKLDLPCFTYDSPSVEIVVFSWDLFCLHSTKQYGKTCLLYCYRFSIVLKYFCSWFSSTTYWCSFWSISTTHRWLRQLFRYVCLSSAGHLAPIVSIPGMHFALFLIAILIKSVCVFCLNM